MIVYYKYPIGKDIEIKIKEEIPKIDDYGFNKEELKTKNEMERRLYENNEEGRRKDNEVYVKNLFNNEAALRILYKGTDSSKAPSNSLLSIFKKRIDRSISISEFEALDSAYHRRNFLNFLANKLKNITIRAHLDYDEKPVFIANSKETIDLAELIGKDGVEFYKKAIDEEWKSREFINAVVKKASFGTTDFVEKLRKKLNVKWEMATHLIVAGPSGVGKSFSSFKIIDELSNDDKINKYIREEYERLEGSATGSIKYFIFSDGGIEREVSQMRKMVLQCALALGYSGIKDLEKLSKVEKKLKKIIKKAALISNVHLIEPNTFTSSLGRWKPNESPSKLVIFATIVGEKAAVAKSGAKRAWYSGDNALSVEEMDINKADMPCESKKYTDYFNDGVRWSNYARGVYNDKYLKTKIFVDMNNSLDDYLIEKDSDKRKKAMRRLTLTSSPTVTDEKDWEKKTFSKPRAEFYRKTRDKALESELINNYMKDLDTGNEISPEFKEEAEEFIKGKYGSTDLFFDPIKYMRDIEKKDAKDFEVTITPRRR